MQLMDMINLAEEDARIEGREEGFEIGQEVIVRMNEYLLAQDRIEDLKRATTDKEFRDAILAEIEAAEADA